MSDTKKSLIDYMPDGWIRTLADEFGVNRNNLRHILRGQFSSKRSQDIRKNVRLRLIDHFRKSVNELEQILDS